MVFRASETQTIESDFFTGKQDWQTRSERNINEEAFVYSLRDFFIEPSLLKERQESRDMYQIYQIEILKKMMLSYSENEFDPTQLEQEMFLAIASEYSKINEVRSIYVQKYREEIQIYILLSIDQYNNTLMDRLLDIEYEIRKNYIDIVFEFFYPPAGLSKKEDFIHPKALCIFAR